MTDPTTPVYPFSAFLALNEDLKIALLPLIDQRLGGLLLLGDYGSAKSSLARSLSVFLDEKSKFVDVPLGVTLDRLLGGVDVQAVLSKQTFLPQLGLLERANQGVLYMDEIHLMPANILDHLLDVSVLGHYYLERDGLSRCISSSFVFIASMNEDVDYLPRAMVDRFGLSLTLKGLVDISKRTQALKWQLEFSKNSKEFCSHFSDVEKKTHDRILRAKANIQHVVVSADIVNYVAEKMIAVGARGLRADLTLLKSIRALAALENCPEANKQHVDYLLPFVLEHRQLKQQKNTNRPPNFKNMSRNSVVDGMDNEEQQAHFSSESGQSALSAVDLDVGKKKTIKLPR